MKFESINVSVTDQKTVLVDFNPGQAQLELSPGIAVKFGQLLASAGREIEGNPESFKTTEVSPTTKARKLRLVAAIKTAVGLMEKVYTPNHNNKAALEYAQNRLMEATDGTSEELNKRMAFAVEQIKTRLDEEFSQDYWKNFPEYKQLTEALQ